MNNPNPNMNMPNPNANVPSGYTAPQTLPVIVLDDIANDQTEQLMGAANG